jgi:hypothetical protein
VALELRRDLQEIADSTTQLTQSVIVENQALSERITALENAANGNQPAARRGRPKKETA